MLDFFKKKAAPEPAPAAPTGVSADLLERVVQALGVSDDDTILQIGIADASVLRHVMPLVPQGRIGGVDSDTGKVQAAIAQFPSEYRAFKAEFKEGVASRLPFTDEHFTKVYALDSVGGWLSIPKGLAEIKRVLFPLGRVVFSLPPKQRAGVAFVPVVEVKALLVDAGFEGVEILPAEDPEASVIVMGQKAF